MARHTNLTHSDHKRLGRLLSQGVPFNLALQNVQGGRPRKHTSGLGRSSGLAGSNNSTIQEFIGLLEFISGALTAVAVLSLFVTYGSGLLGLIVVGIYLLFWEVVGMMFDEARKKTPTPLRFLVTIIEDIFGISF